MKFPMGACAVIAGLSIAASAAEQANPPVPEVALAIPPSVKNLGEPSLRPFPAGLKIAVSTYSEKAQAHVVQGLNHLHGGWEFEASRHFARAMELDPQCLLAHWGMVMALLDSSPETLSARQAAVARLGHLMQQEQGTALEQGYAYGLIKYLTEGAAGAANGFRKVAERFPNEMQAAIFTALFSRGGFDANGDPTPDQVASEQALSDLMQKFPDSSIPLNALLVVRAEAPNPEASLELARKLTEMEPGYPPAFHLLGHYEWRNGNHRRAAAAFGRASMFYRQWMEQNQVGVADCPEWIKAECYRVVALLSMGDDATAYAAARQIAATPIPVDRPSSAGARFLLWDGKTLPARILIHRGLKSNAASAALSLPDPESIKPTFKHSKAYWWIDGLRIALEALRQTDQGDLDQARTTALMLENHIDQMGKTEESSWASGEGAHWMRAHRALKVLLGDVRGRIALSGPADLRNSAFNWYSSAMEHQRHAPMLHPPMILTPMAARLGDYYLEVERPQDAIDAYLRALDTIPSDIHSLTGLRLAYLAAGQKDDAVRILLQIQSLQNP